MEGVANQVMRHNCARERSSLVRDDTVGPEDSLVDNVGG